MSGEKDVPEKFHSELGASIAGRWMACPGSVRLARALPPGGTSEYAQEGTRAHALAELSLRRKVDPHTFVGTTLEGGDVTEEMAEAVKVYTDYCRALWTSRTLWWAERRFNLSTLNPVGPMYGTADFVALDTVRNTLHVVDLKFGQGVVVEAANNPQLKYYALGAALSMEKGTSFDTVEMTIVQPRALHSDGPIRTETISLEELLGFAGDLLQAAKATTEPDAPLNPGRHCRFCPASGVCPAQQARAESVAMVEFAEMPAAKPQDPATLTPVQLGNLLALLPQVEEWAASVRAHAFAKLERGETVPGMKLVAKRANRSWIDEDKASQYLQNVLNIGEDDLLVSKLKSPAQIEKITKKSRFPDELTQKVSSGFNMVPEHDPRPAVSLTAGSEFAALPPAAIGASTKGDNGEA